MRRIGEAHDMPLWRHDVLCGDKSRLRYDFQLGLLFYFPLQVDYEFRSRVDATPGNVPGAIRFPVFLFGTLQYEDFPFRILQKNLHSYLKHDVVHERASVTRCERNSGNETPTAASDLGRSDSVVRPGSVLVSR